jgi:transcriptional regulator with XRE-family HTH domain
MNIIKNITNPLERRRVQFGYSQQDISKLLGITQSQYSRIEKGDTNPNKHTKKLSEIFNCEPKEVFQGRILREIEDDFLNDPTNRFQRTFHERKHGLVHLKIEGWFTRKQITDNYEMLIKELDKWNVNEDGIRWKYK